MTTPKWLSGTISKQTNSETSGHLTGEAGVSRTLSVNIEHTYYNYEVRTLTFSYVRATKDV